MEDLMTSLTATLGAVDWEGMFSMLKEAFAKLQESGIFDKIVATFASVLTAIAGGGAVTI